LAGEILPDPDPLEDEDEAEHGPHRHHARRQGTDCGFGTFVGYGIDPGVAWAKLGSLVEGVRLASAELW